MAEKFGAPVGKTILIALGGYAFAWCVGFVIVIAPAGAGVREVLLIVSLTPVIGRGPAIAVAACSRAVNTDQRPAGGRRGRRDPPSRAQRHRGHGRGKRPAADPD